METREDRQTHWEETIGEGVDAMIKVFDLPGMPNDRYREALNKLRQDMHKQVK